MNSTTLRLTNSGAFAYPRRKGLSFPHHGRSWQGRATSTPTRDQPAPRRGYPVCGRWHTIGEVRHLPVIEGSPSGRRP